MGNAVHTELSRHDLRGIRSELERECSRFGEDDARRHKYVVALARVEDGTYGLCVACGDAIPFDRLTAIPETLYCIQCGSRL